MNEKSIQQILLKELYPKRAKILNTNYWLGYGEADLVAINHSDYVIEYEIKCSRSDFKADRKKVKKHKMYLGTHSFGKRNYAGVPNRLYYVCPAMLLKPEDMFTYSGLIYVHENGRLETIVKAPLIHSQKVTPKVIESIAHSLTIKLVYKGLSNVSSYNDVPGIEGTPFQITLDKDWMANPDILGLKEQSSNDAKEFFKNLK